MPLLDPKDPFFAKPWVRWVTAGVPLVWGVAEFAMGNPGWGLMFLAAGGYAAFVFIRAGR